MRFFFLVLSTLLMGMDQQRKESKRELDASANA